jgi:hypothetical protein
MSFGCGKVHTMSDRIQGGVMAKVSSDNTVDPDGGATHLGFDVVR